MTTLHLSFPVFYYCVVKDNAILRQYDAVHLLLLGRLRHECGTQVLSDAVASNYVSGRKRITHELYKSLLSTSIDEIARRIRRLNLRNTALAVKNLQCFLPEDYLTQGNDFANGNTDGDPYRFLAEVFLLSLQCPNYKLRVITKADVAAAISFYGESRNSQSDTALEQIINILQTHLAPNTIIKLCISQHSQPDIVLRVRILGTENP